MKICDYIMTFIATLRPALGQVLLFYNTYHKTASNTILVDLHKRGHGLSYTETRFNEDKWPEWSSNQPPIITSNIHKGMTTTHIIDSTDRKNKDLDSPETHNTNTILIQNFSNDQQFSSSVHVEPNYDFSRKDHNSFKTVTTALLNIHFKRGTPKLVPSIIEDDQNKKFQNSSKKTLGWVLLKDIIAHPSSMRVSAWSSSNQILRV